MNVPLVICNGLIRSGSTWSFNVCRALVGGKSGYFSKEQLDGFVRHEWKRADQGRVAKAHELGPAALAALYSGRAKAVCTYRDPRDCVASDLTFLGRDFEYSLGRVAYSFSLLQHYLTNKNVMLVKYEKMMVDPTGEIQRIADHLDVVIDERLVNEIDLQTGIHAAKALCNELVRDLDKPSVMMDSHRVDVVTQLHENHIFSGEIGRWKHELTGDQIVRVQTVFSRWLKELGYDF